MEVICIEKEALYTLVVRVIERLKEESPRHEKWLNTEQAMAKLHIRSNSTLQKLRNEGKIRFSQPKKSGSFTMRTQSMNIWRNMRRILFNYKYA